MAATATAVSTVSDELHRARVESDALFRIVRAERLYDRPIDARHRIIFYIGHLDGFDSIQICREGLGVPSFDRKLDELFQAGIDPDSGHLPTDEPSDWPAISQVEDYVARCREHVDRYAKNAPEELLHMAVEHRLMHLETLAYMLHNLPHRWKQTASDPKMVVRGAGVRNEYREVPAGEAVLGKQEDGTFGWDNEFREHRVFVPAFRMQRYAVTNGEYLEFVTAGAALPNFWRKRGHSIWLRGMFEDLPLPLDWPVYVKQEEAQAYAHWRGERLATEAEYHRAAHGAQPSTNIDFRSWDPIAVHADRDSASAWGIEQLIGNGWEWTATPFGPFPGFQPRASYPGYSANFFDGEHFVMKGGSARTAARLLRSSFRNWFRRDYPYMYAKFRCVQD